MRVLQVMLLISVGAGCWTQSGRTFTAAGAEWGENWFGSSSHQGCGQIAGDRFGYSVDALRDR